MNINLSGSRDLPGQVGNDLRKAGKWEETAETIGSNLSAVEDQLITELGKGEEGDQSLIQQLQIKYDKALRLLEALSKLTERAHDMMMRIISRIGGR